MVSFTDRKHKKKCTVFPFHPWDPKEGRKHGIVMWVPNTIDELIKAASKQLGLPDGSFILSEDGGNILDVDLLVDGQSLYMINETN
ncbi:UNVERIFIED_CONTAM: Potassium channel SKOR [Sesamum radiatum]|uniref:Potassium channel SKOR n=1 Tax=Sesamum radiatum TaxID=300843 RepID=A0AAW2VR03_SESRA